MEKSFLRDFSQLYTLTGYNAALIDCLQTTYGDKAIDYLVAKFAPAKDGNNVKIYTKFLRDKTGVTDDKKVKDFTPEEFDKLWRAIEIMEGYQEGSITEVFPVIQAHKDKKGISDLNVKMTGWTPKAECIQLAKQGVLKWPVLLKIAQKILVKLLLP